MAKRKRRAAKRPAAARGPAAASAAPACNLQEVPSTPDFEAATGAEVTLSTHEHIGAIFIAKAEYGGQQLIPDGQAHSTIRFTTLAGRNTLKLVFVFSASTAGHGELREDCGDGESHFVRALVGTQPLHIIRITGT